jgi:hypothetical protein
MNATLTFFSSGVLDAAKEAGTMSMQQLLLAAIIAMGVALIYMHWDNKRTMATLMGRMNERESAMTQERISRLNMLMEIIQKDTIAKTELKAAIDNNTQTISRFETLLTKLIGTKVVL